MERPRKSKGVSWDKGSKLCQVKYLSSDDSPSQIGRKSQGGHHHLQANPTSILRSTNESNDLDLPPGFESGPFLNQPMVKWECPPQFVISPHWLVAAGEASEEKDTEKLRELRMIEAHYPRPSSIPPSPLVSLDVEDEDYDDTATPIVSLIPIEETEDYKASLDLVPLIPTEVQEEVAMDISPERTVANAPSDMQSHKLQQQHLSATTTPLSSGCNPSSSTVSSNVGGVTDLSKVSAQDLAAAAALIEAILKITQDGSLIDVDLLVKILNNYPQMVERLSTENRNPPPNLSTATSSNNPLSISTFGLNPTFPPMPPMPPMPLPSSPPCGVATYSGTTPLTGVASLLPSPVVKPSAPSFTVLNPALNNMTTQIPAVISSYSMVNFIHDSHQTTIAASTPLSWHVSAPNTSDPQMQLSWPACTPFESTTVVNENIHKSNGVPIAAALNIPPQQDIVQASSSSRMKRAASFSISSNEQSSVQFSSTTEKYLNTFGTQITARTKTTQHASKSNTSSSRGAAARDDGDYYKNLVRKRDEARQVKQDSRSSFRESKMAAQDIRHQETERHRSERPACIYYNSPRGCRNGAKCRFRHEVSSRREADSYVQGSSYLKKMRL